MSTAVIERTTRALKSKGFHTDFAENRDEAREKILGMIPNVVTEDGYIMSVDGPGNHVAGMISGPKVRLDNRCDARAG